MKKNNKKANLLDCVPHKNPSFNWNISEDGKVTIFVENKGVFNFIAQKLFSKPRVSQVHLEVYGSFIWPLIDGKTTVMELGQRVSQKFGSEAEPLYERLAMYFKSLQSYGFIEL